MNKKMKLSDRILLLCLSFGLSACSGDVNSLSCTCDYNDMMIALNYVACMDSPTLYFDTWIQAKSKYEVEKDVQIYIDQNFEMVSPYLYNCDLSQKINVSIIRLMRSFKNDKFESQTPVANIEGTLQDFFASSKHNAHIRGGVFNTDCLFEDKITTDTFPDEEKYIISYKLSFSSSTNEYLQIEGAPVLKGYSQSVDDQIKVENIYSLSGDLICIPNNGYVHLEPIIEDCSKGNY